MKRTFFTTGIIFLFAIHSFAQPAEVLKSDASSAEGQEEYALAAKNYEAAAKAFKNQNIIDSLCIYRAGYNYLKTEQYNKAIPFLQESIGLNYNLSRSYQLLSDAYLGINNAQKAGEVLLEGRKKVPGDETDFDKKLAYLYFNTGEYKKAAYQFARLDSLFPGNKSYMYLHGFALERIQKYDQAIEVLEKEQELFPDDKKARKILGLAWFERTDILNDKEVKRYESMKNAKLEDYIGTTKRLDQINTGYEKARGILEESLHDFPGDKLVIGTLYKIYKKQKKDDMAAQMQKLLK